MNERNAFYYLQYQDKEKYLYRIFYFQGLQLMHTGLLPPISLTLIAGVKLLRVIY